MRRSFRALVAIVWLSAVGAAKDFRTSIDVDGECLLGDQPIGLAIPDVPNETSLVNLGLGLRAKHHDSCRWASFLSIGSSE